MHQVHPTASQSHLAEERATALAQRVARNPRNPQRKHPIAQKCHHCRQQRQRHQHGEGHRHGCGNAHQGHKRHLGQSQCSQGHNHSHAGKDHRRTGGTSGHTDSVGLTHTSAKLSPIAGENKEGVVNTHRQAEHHGQNRGDGINVGEHRHQHHTQDTNDDAHNGGDNRQNRCGHRTEGDNKHHKCHRDTNNLRGGLHLDRRLHTGT